MKKLVSLGGCYGRINLTLGTCMDYGTGGWEEV